MSKSAYFQLHFIMKQFLSFLRGVEFWCFRHEPKMSLPRLCFFWIIPFPYYLNIISHKEWANTIMIICPKKHIYFIINTLELNIFHPFHRHQLASLFLFFAQQEIKKLKIMNLSPKASYHAYTTTDLNNAE